MLAKIKKKISGDLVKVLSLTALANLIKVGINLITTKVVAVLIGPNGVALVGQFTNLINILTTTSTGGISNGTIRYVSEHKDDIPLYNKYVGTSFSITLFFSTLSTIILLVFSKQICIALFDDLTYISIIYITAFTLFLYSINTFLLSVINGKKLYNNYIVINLLSSFVGFIFTLILVYYFKVYGSLLALATYQSVVILITVQVIKRKKLFSLKEIDFSFSKTRWLFLLSYSLMAVIGLIWPVINIAIRSLIISEVSISSAGIWEGMNRVSGFILAIMGTAITTYFLPRFSEIKNNVELRKELISGLKIVLSVTLFIVLCLYFLKTTVIQILFTEAFMMMEDLFLFQLMGDFFWVAKMIFTTVLIAKAMMREYIVLEALFGILYLGLTWLFISNGYGLKSIPVAHFIYNLIYFLVMIFVFNKTFDESKNKQKLLMID